MPEICPDCGNNTVKDSKGGSSCPVCFRGFNDKIYYEILKESKELRLNIKKGELWDDVNSYDLPLFEFIVKAVDELQLSEYPNIKAYDLYLEVESELGEKGIDKPNYNDVKRVMLQD